MWTERKKKRKKKDRETAGKQARSSWGSKSCLLDDLRYHLSATTN